MNAENNTGTLPVFGDFLVTVDEGRMLTLHGHPTDYVWTGLYQNHANGVRQAVLYGTEGTLTWVDVNSRSPWMLSDPAPAALFRAAKLAALKALDKSASDHALTQMTAQLRGVRRDVEIINEMANEEANRRNMCGAYEDFVEEINQRLTHVELVGRSKEFDVEVGVTVRYRLDVQLSVVDREAAQNEVENMTEDDIMRALAEQNGQRVGDGYLDFDFDVLDVRDSDNC